MGLGLYWKSFPMPFRRKERFSQRHPLCVSYFNGPIDPSHGWKLSTCNDETFGNILRFLNPIFCPRKPSYCTMSLANTILMAWQRGVTINWACWFRGVLSEQLRTLKAGKPTYLPSYLAQLYHVDGCLTRKEAVERDRLIREVRGEEFESESEAEDSIQEINEEEEKSIEDQDMENNDEAEPEAESLEEDIPLENQGVERTPVLTEMKMLTLGQEQTSNEKLVMEEKEAEFETPPSPYNTREEHSTPGDISPTSQYSPTPLEDEGYDFYAPVTSSPWRSETAREVETPSGRLGSFMVVGEEGDPNEEVDVGDTEKNDLGQSLDLIPDSPRDEQMSEEQNRDSTPIAVMETETHIAVSPTQGIDETTWVDNYEDEDVQVPHDRFRGPHFIEGE